ncbi:MAG: sulfotransferase [Sphingobacteriales bacterium]
MQSRALIVAGMHRSGTSLITNWLYHCGLQVGESLVKANDGNKEGHYEDVEFLRLHEEILAGNGLSPGGLVHDQSISISEYQLAKLKAVIGVKENHFEQWGWKEPRTCLFLDIYKDLLPGAKYLVIVRDHMAVVNSLLKRGFEEIYKPEAARSFFSKLKWDIYKKAKRREQFYRAYAEDYLKVWIDYNEHILNILRRLPKDDYLVINYTMLEKEDRQVFSFLTHDWRFKLEYFPFGKVYNKNLISPQADLHPFLKDTSLIAKAGELENEFSKYMTLA